MARSILKLSVESMVSVQSLLLHLVLNTTNLEREVECGPQPIWTPNGTIKSAGSDKNRTFIPRSSCPSPSHYMELKKRWNVMSHAQKPDFVFRRNGRVHLNRQGRQFSRLLAAEVCTSAVVMLDTPCSEVVWRVLATNSIRQFPPHFPSHASPCTITFQLESIYSEKLEQ